MIAGLAQNQNQTITHEKNTQTLADANQYTYNTAFRSICCATEIDGEADVPTTGY